MRTARHHVPATRTLAAETYSAAWAGEVLCTESYGYLYPDHDSVADGMQATLETLCELRKGSDDISQLTTMVREADRQTRLPMALFAGISSTAYLLGANAVLGSQAFPKSSELTPTALAKRDHYGYFPDEESLASTMTLHPDAYYQTIDGLGELHAVYETEENTLRLIGPLKHASEMFCTAQFGGRVVADLADQLKGLCGSSNIEEWYTEVVRLPYKHRLFDWRFRESDFLAQKQEARLAIEGLRNNLTNNRHKVLFKRSLNYESTLRAVCASYHAFRKQNFSPQASVQALYANSRRFTALTMATTDANVTIGPLNTDTASSRLNHMEEHSLERLYGAEYLPVVSNVNGEPILHFPHQPALPYAEIPKEVSAKVHERSEQTRRVGGRCPMRHKLPHKPVGERKDYFLAFQEGLQRSGNGISLVEDGWIHPTAVAIATTILAAEHYELFSAIDEVTANAGL